MLRPPEYPEWLPWCPGEIAAYGLGCRFDISKAERVRKFFRQVLRHSKGQFAGKPFELLDWQWQQVIAPLYGWMRPDGTRRFRKGGIWVPKKNGKSSLSSGLSLYMLVADGEPGAEVYCAASDRDQAGIVFNESANMVEDSPGLSGQLDVVRSTKRIVFARTHSMYRALSAEVRTKEGINWHFCLFDELHAQPDRKMFDTLTYGGAARRQPLFLSISTAGSDRESIGYEQYTYAKNVLSGQIDDPWFFGFVAEAPKESDWKSPAVWRSANPSIDVTIKEEELAEACKEAVNSPAKENSFRRYRLNQWTDAFTRWINSEAWNNCQHDFELDDLEGQDCFAGLDLSSTLDTTSLSLVFPGDDGEYAVLPFFWVPEESCKERERRNKTRLDEWARRGYLVKTPGNCVDYGAVRKLLLELKERYNIREIAIDRWNATGLATQLAEDGFEVVAFGQGYASMSDPSKMLEKLILDRKLLHNGNPVLTWMVGNCEIEMDAAGNVKPSKKRSTEKIDGVVSLVMALGRAIVQPELVSVYDDPETPVR